MYDLDDTIVAIASAPGGALRGIVRLSGPETVGVVSRLFQTATDQPLRAVQSARRVAGEIFLGGALAAIPGAVYLWPTERSYTRQPLAELHTLGSPPLLEAIVRTACGAGARLAQSGEFTLRAFLAGRLDLTQAEAVLGVIDATSQHDLDVALSQLAGGLAAPLHELREQLMNLLAHLEAGLDFVEEDIEFIQRDELLHGLDSAATVIAAAARQLESRGEVDVAPCVVLAGSPNVGKSSLLNALVGDTAAIVSPVSGTTRDYVARPVRLGDRDITLVDTAGVEQPGTVAGLLSQARDATRTQQQQAALVLLCVDATRPLNDWEASQLQSATATPRFVVVTKRDIGGSFHAELNAIQTSSRSGFGLCELRQAIYDHMVSDGRHAVTSTALRCRDSLRLARSSIERAYGAACNSLGEELVAAELRVALDELGSVVGAVYTDDILDRIFSRFCIGK